MQRPGDGVRKVQKYGELKTGRIRICTVAPDSGILIIIIGRHNADELNLHKYWLLCIVHSAMQGLKVQAVEILPHSSLTSETSLVVS